MDGFEKRKAKSRQQIQETATRLFARNGFRAVTVSRIAREAGTSPVTLYNHFGSKDLLLRTIVLDFFEEHWKVFLDIQTRPLSFREKMEALLTAKATAELSHPEMLNLIPPDHPEVQDVIEDFYQNRTIPLFRDMIRQGKAEGQLASHLSEEAILFYLQLFRQGQNHPDFLAPDNTILRLGLLQLFFYGLLGQPPEDHPFGDLRTP